MAERTAPALPMVVATSVVRSTHQGESHGGVFLIDLATTQVVQVVDWNDREISWEGRGGDRGLRGVAFHRGRVYLAASDEIFVFDQGFRKIDAISCPFLKHCHEIAIHRNLLYLTSTAFDSILIFDLDAWRFREGICLRPLALAGWRFQYHRAAKGIARRLSRLSPAFRRLFAGALRARSFDPVEGPGPRPVDMLHINNVHGDDRGLYICGTELDALLRLRAGRLERIATVPLGTHNTRPTGDGVLYQDTVGERVILAAGGRPDAEFALPQYPAARLVNAHLERDHARPAFGRGLCVTNDGLIVAGSSPATISVFRRGSPQPLRTLNLTMDVRNAIHGLEVWPFDRRLTDWLRRHGEPGGIAAEGPGTVLERAQDRP